MAAEAVVFFNPTHASEFESRRKRGGHLWSKMRFLSAQLIAYLEDGLWLRNASHANAMAARLAAGLATVHGVRLVQKAQANELFVEMPDRLIESLLAEGFEFYRWASPPGVTGSVVRLVTSFCTTERDVDMLVEAARR
jgi:threonine aldolase